MNKINGTVSNFNGYTKNILCYKSYRKTFNII